MSVQRRSSLGHGGGRGIVNLTVALNTAIVKGILRGRITKFPTMLCCCRPRTYLIVQAQLSSTVFVHFEIASRALGAPEKVHDHVFSG